MKEIRAVALLKDSQLSAVREQVRSSVSLWSERWFPKGLAPSVGTCERGSPQEPMPPDRATADCALEGFAVCLPDALADEWLARLLGRDTPGVIGQVERAGYRAWRDAVIDDVLADALLLLVGGGALPGNPEAVHWVSGEKRKTGPARAGGIRCRLHFGDREWSIFLEGEVLARVLRHLGCERPAQMARKGGLASWDQAIQGPALTLEVRSAPTTISCEQLRELSIGDVVELDHRVESPFEVRTHAGAFAGLGFLGQCHGARAMRATISPERARNDRS